MVAKGDKVLERDNCLMSAAKAPLAKRREIFAEAGRHGLSTEEVKALVWQVSGQGRMAELTAAEAEKVIERIQTLGKDGKPWQIK
jgi:hypothetical protein